MGYFRRAIRAAATMDQVQEIALTLCMEIEKHEEWARVRGVEIPRWYVTRAEAEEKNLEIGA